MSGYKWPELTILWYKYGMANITVGMDGPQMHFLKTPAIAS